MLLAIGPTWIGLLALLACLFGPTVARAQNVDISVDGGAPQSAAAPMNLSATVSTNAVAATFRVSSQSAVLSTEQQKCKDLLELAKADFDSVFNNAVSSLHADFALTEARAKDALETSWKGALQKANESAKLGLDFGGTQSYIPLISDLSVSVRNSKFSGVATSAQRFLTRSFERIAAAGLKQDLKSLNSSGVMRFSSDNQAAVCYAVLVNRFSVAMRFNGRTFDRVFKTSLLDRACFTNTIKTVSESIRKRSIKAEDIKDLATFAFLVGIHGSRIHRSYGVLSGSEPNRFCPVSNGDVVDDLDATNEWKKAINIWFESAKATNSLSDPISDLSKFDQIGFRTTLSPTNIWYEYTIDVEGAAK